MKKPVNRKLMTDREFLYELDRKILYYGHHIVNFAELELELDHAVEMMRMMSHTTESFSLAVICRMVLLGYLKYDSTHTKISATGKGTWGAPKTKEEIGSWHFTDPRNLRALRMEAAV